MQERPVRELGEPHCINEGTDEEASLQRPPCSSSLYRL